jgi:hypothetical protein
MTLLVSPDTVKESIDDLCRTTDPSKSLSVAIKKRFNFTGDQIVVKMDMILKLNYHCSVDVLFKYLGRTPSARLARVLKVIEEDPSESSVNQVCAILVTYLRARSGGVSDLKAVDQISSEYSETPQYEEYVNKLLNAEEKDK